MLNLIPAPRGSVHMQEGSVKLPETVTVSLGDFAPWCLEAFAARLDGHVETAENGFITLKKADIAKEGYKLTVTKDGITVEAADESGAVWALTTVTELTAEGEALPIVTIEGTPHTDAEREMVRPVIEKFAQIWFRPQDVPEMMKNDDLVGAALNFMKMFPPENDETKGE